MKLPPSVTRSVRISLWLLRLERVWPLLRWLSLWLLFALGLALIDLGRILPLTAHVILLITLLLGILIIFKRTYPHKPWPDHDAAQRRLEHTAQVKNQPFAALADQPARPLDRLGTQLWSRHKAHALNTLTQLRGIRFLPGSAPIAVQVSVMMLLIMGFISGKQEIGSRIQRFLIPGSETLALPPIVEAWITPPAYTRAPTILLHRVTDTGSLAVPEGSQINLRITGHMKRYPNMTLGHQTHSFTQEVPDVWESITTLTENQTPLIVKQGNIELASWLLNVIPDQHPRIAFKTPPSSYQDLYIALRYQAEDDYGVTRVEAIIQRAEFLGEEKIDSKEAPLILELYPSGPGQKTLAGDSLEDLTSHRWAGLEVSLVLQAYDAKGQKGISKPAKLRLPTRTFHHSLAKKIIAERQRFMINPYSTGESVAQALRDLATQDDQQNKDVAVSLGLALAAHRIMLDPGPKTTSAIADLTWLLALRLEEGKAATAASELLALKHSLEDALRIGQGSETIHRLLDELKSLTHRFLDALSQDNAQISDLFSDQLQATRNLDQKAIESLFQHIGDLIDIGELEAAYAMMNDFERMIQTLSAGRNAMLSPEVIETLRLIEALQGLASEQRALIKDTFSIQSRHDQHYRDRFADLSKRQLAIQSKLEAAMPDLYANNPIASQQRSQEAGPINDAIWQQYLTENRGEEQQQADVSAARNAMQRAARYLSLTHGDSALSAEGEALQALNNIADRVRNSLNRMPGSSGSFMLPGLGPLHDPFGRSVGHPMGQTERWGKARLDQDQINDMRALIKELRSRASDSARDSNEYRYLKRLLDFYE